MNKYLSVLLMASLIFLVSCENDYPDSVYNSSQEYGLAPAITALDPPGGVYAGIDDITISGQNFSDQLNGNFVFFSGLQAQVLSYSATEVVVRAPIIEGDSLKVQLTTAGLDALEIAEFYPYKIEFAAIEYGKVNDQTSAGGIACDDDENVYVSNGTLLKIVKIPGDGSDPEDFALIPNGALITMKMGPDGYLYGGRTKWISKISPDGATVDSVNRKPDKLGQSLKDIDFDENGNIFIAAKKYIYCMKSDGSNFEAAAYDGTTGGSYSLKTVRVFNGYVYVAGDLIGINNTVEQKGLWRNQILDADGNLGPNELVYDWGAYVGIGGAGITALTFSDDGMMYVGLDNTHAIVTLTDDGSGSYLNADPAPLYEAVLLPPSTNFVWGDDQYLYVNRSSTDIDLMRLIRVTTGKMSAPYYGR